LSFLNCYFRKLKCDRVESAWLVHRPARTAAGLRALVPGVSAVDLDGMIAAI
jgi:hypothetical protein